MRKFLKFILSIAILFLISPVEVYATTNFILYQSFENALNSGKPKIPIIENGLPTSLPNMANTYININDFDLIGDGVTSNDTAVSDLIKSIPAYSKVTLEPGKLYVITQPILLTKPINIDLMGSTIICKNATSVFKIQSDDITIKNGILDLNFTTHNGITGRGYNRILIENLVVKDLLPSATNLEGGIYLTSCTDISINQCIFKNIINSADPGPVDHSPAIKFVLCENCSVKQFKAENCGVGVNCYGSENVLVSYFSMSKIHNNGFYIQNNSKNINIQNGKVDEATNGLAFNLSNYTTGILPTTVSCIEVEFSNISNKGISLRNGSGLAVIGCRFIEAGYAVGQSANYDGCSNITITENTVEKPSGKIPFYFKNDTHMNIHNNTLKVSFSAKTLAIKLDKGCNNNNIHDNFILGDGVLLKRAIPVVYKFDSNR